VRIDESQGWVLTQYFYDSLIKMERSGDGLRDEIAPMIYGMDVDRQRHHAAEILFEKEAPVDPLRPAPQPRKIEGMDLAELDLMNGNVGDAADLAGKALVNPQADHGRATYLLARIDLMQGDPDTAQKGFEKALTLTRDPRTLAWSHIYLGRLYDIEFDDAHNLMREKAIAEYKAALAMRDSRPDTKIAAESGLAKPFQPPQRVGSKVVESKQVDADDKDFDPTGKAEKDAYRPDSTQKPAAAPEKPGPPK
jgi:tetratricopeptide (TPR) repeat protein